MRVRPLALVLLAILATTAVRVRLAGTPLERDEGEYAYAGQLILAGQAPYEAAYNMKFPGTYYAYAGLMALFGQTARGIRTGLALVTAASALLLFLFARRFLGHLPAAAVAAVFVVLVLDRHVMGLFAHATHFVVLCTLAGFVLLLRALESERRLLLVVSGASFGLAVMMKQHAVLFLIVAGGLALGLRGEATTWRLRSGLARAALLAAGSVLPLAAVVAVVAHAGLLDRFWLWTFRYARQYVSEVSLAQAGPQLVAALGGVTRSSLPLWLAAGAGLATLWLRPWPVRTRIVVSAFVAASGLAVCPGFYFREHYFIVLLPALALLTGVLVAAPGEGARPAPARAGGRWLPILVVVFGVMWFGVHEARALSAMTPVELSRAVYGSNPFVEAVEVAREIRARSAPDERIAVLGSEPEIYFYSRRRSATGYVYMYPLMAPRALAGKMQAEMIREIEAAHPSYVVWVPVATSWLVGPSSDRSVLKWSDQYLKAHFDPVGIAQRDARGEISYLWDEAVAKADPQASTSMVLFRRR